MQLKIDDQNHTIMIYYGLEIQLNLMINYYYLLMNEIERRGVERVMERVRGSPRRVSVSTEESRVTGTNCFYLCFAFATIWERTWWRRAKREWGQPGSCCGCDCEDKHTSTTHGGDCGLWFVEVTATLFIMFCFKDRGFGTVEVPLMGNLLQSVDRHGLSLFSYIHYHCFCFYRIEIEFGSSK